MFLWLFAPFIFILLSVDTMPIRVELSYNHKDKSHILGIPSYTESKEPGSLLTFSNRYVTSGFII